MSYPFEQGKDAIIDAVVKSIDKKLDKAQADNCNIMVKQLLQTVSLDDLLSWQIEDLTAAMLNFWVLIYEKGKDEQRVRIYNPDYERHGWQTTHTVVEIIHQDMPFLVDTVHMEITRMKLTSHLIVHMGGLKVCRDKDNRITKVLSDNEESQDCLHEAIIFMQINRITDIALLESLHQNLDTVLEDNRSAVIDWQEMRQNIKNTIESLDNYAHFISHSDLSESKDFLSWLEDHHFTFLGMRDYVLEKKEQGVILKPVSKSGLGVLRDDAQNGRSRNVSKMTPEGRDLTLSNELLIISKTNTRSTVHRPAYTDYIGIKKFNDKHEVIGERRIIGLYTSIAYHTNPKHIPFLRRKVQQIMKLSRFDARSHAGKVLQNILDTLPRDDLFQASIDTLFEIAMGIFYMQERQRIRMFAWRDVYGRFISCLVFVPRERFDTTLRKRMQRILCEAFQSDESSFSTQFSESELARIHFIIRLKSTEVTDYDFKAIEAKLVEVGKSWSDYLQQTLLEVFGEEESHRLYQKYHEAFSISYQESFSARTAVYDIKHIERLSDISPIRLNFYRPIGDISKQLRFKIYCLNETVPLSDVIPILEDLGLRIISERPYSIEIDNKHHVWINDFVMIYDENSELNVEELRERFEEAFLAVWYKRSESDKFNQLILAAGLTWHSVSVLRAYAKYLKQIRFTFSQDYIESALINNTHIAQKFTELFELKFSPDDIKGRNKRIKHITEELNEQFELVINLDEDKILRRYLDLIVATLRTNYYQQLRDANQKPYLSFKIKPELIPGIPKPIPQYEIFVYSPRFEGVHLRGGKVARGGLRWSDRREDFRTEVLGLMKAQQVKNAVIVPSGAKGGFVPKRLPSDGTREEIMTEGVYCYKQFIRGLLDITDNYDKEVIHKPKDVVCYDEDDPYLVVAADKGTATFSDIANEISKEYDFWLGDAFASGGSDGYDHKKMGITAKGAWESVKRHFRELNIDIQGEDVTVVGIGDMAGDVFGNGMLLSEHICLVGAFNHMHIFLDPTPDSSRSFSERKRLFSLPRSSWDDYNRDLISEGGGVFSRKAKYIRLTPEIKQCFGLEVDKIEPDDLIKVMLKSKVDLLWNGGIGTFVKARSESHDDAGDRTNDVIRVNGDELRCRVIGEGGNLGLTQLGRIEYALSGGAIYTDFIDNSAGVDCSDNEVNIKILLNGAVENGDMTLKQRNALLVNMTEDVEALVLKNNYKQTLAISIALRQSLKNIELHARYIDFLEKEGKLDRILEFIPDQNSLQERKLLGKGLLTPGISVLLCYSKIYLKEKILASSVTDDHGLTRFLVEAFPKQLQEKFSDEINRHKLRHEILATKLSSMIVNEVGFTFVYRLQDETGAPVSAIVRAYIIVRTIFSMEQQWTMLEALDNKIDSELQLDLMMQFSRLLRRSTRWLLRNKRKELDVAENIKLYGEGVDKLKQTILNNISDTYRPVFEQDIKDLVAKRVPQDVAMEIVQIRFLFSALDIIDSALDLGSSIEDVTKVYFTLSEKLDLNWVRRNVIIHPSETHWEVLSREALRDDLDYQQRQLTAGILRDRQSNETLDQVLERWEKQYEPLISRWQYMLAELRSSSSLNYTMYFVAIRELLDLTQTTVQATLPAICKVES